MQTFSCFTENSTLRCTGSLKFQVIASIGLWVSNDEIMLIHRRAKLRLKVKQGDSFLASSMSTIVILQVKIRKCIFSSRGTLRVICDMFGLHMSSQVRTFNNSNNRLTSSRISTLISPVACSLLLPNTRRGPAAPKKSPRL